MRNFNFFRSKRFTLDLGNNKTLVSDEQSIWLTSLRTLFLTQPTSVLLNLWVRCLQDVRKIT
jgi:hypothetical protein